METLLFLFCFAVLPLIPAGLVILVWSILGFRFSLILEGGVVAVVNAFSAVGWIIILEESYSIHIFGAFLSNYTFPNLIGLISSLLFSYVGLIGLMSGFLMYLGARRWKQYHFSASLLFLIGCGIFFFPSLYFLLAILIQDIG